MFLVRRVYGFFSGNSKFIGWFDDIELANKCVEELNRRDDVLRKFFEYRENIYFENSALKKKHIEECISAYINLNAQEIIDFDRYCLIMFSSLRDYYKVYKSDFFYSFFEGSVVYNKLEEVTSKQNEYSVDY